MSETIKVDTKLTVNGVPCGIRICNRGSLWWWAAWTEAPDGRPHHLRMPGLRKYRSERKAQTEAMAALLEIVPRERPASGQRDARDQAA